MNIRNVGDKSRTRYSFSDAGCLGRECFAPGMYQHRSPLSCGGSRNTGSPDTPCCLNRAYRGCPNGPVGERIEKCHLCDGDGVFGDSICWVCGGRKQITVVGLPLINVDLAKQRKAEGWRKA